MANKTFNSVQHNSWQHIIKGRRTFGTYKIPREIISSCKVRDGQKRTVTFQTQKGRRFILDASITSGCEISLPKKYQNIVQGNEYVEISILSKKAFVFVKPKFAGKSEQQIYSLIKGCHSDYMTLVYLMRGLTSFNYDVSLLPWGEIDSLSFEGTELIVIPQELFIAGSVKRFDVFKSQLEKAIEAGSNLLLTHHHQDEFTKYFRVKSIHYFNSKIESLKLNVKEIYLIKDIEKFWQTRQRIFDEFTYLPLTTDNSLVPVVQKTPKRVPKGFKEHKPFLCLAYKKLSSSNFVFLIDVHATGSKRGDNGKLFKLLLRNVLSFLSNESNNIENAEEKIENAINASSISKTEKEALIASRIGQGKFRDNLIAYWKGCAATKLKKQSLLRASHIKPWRVCNNAERLDTFNGLLLIPNLDQAFDQGYITFNDQGKILVSKTLSENEIQSLGIRKNLFIMIEPKHYKYIRYHRKYVFKK